MKFLQNKDGSGEWQFSEDEIDTIQKLKTCYDSCFFKRF